MSEDKNAGKGLGKGKTAGRGPVNMVPSSAQKVPLKEGREPVKMVPVQPEKPPQTGTTTPPAKPSPTKE